MQRLQGQGSCPSVRQEKEPAMKYRKYNFDNLTSSQLSVLIDDWIKDRRNRDILKDRLIGCMTFGEIAYKYNICERHVKRIVYRYGDYLLSKIQ